MSLVNSNNDWDPLEEIIVGRADHARIPTVDRSTMAFSYADRKIEEIRGLEGPYPKWIIDEANEDLDNLAAELARLGVKVRRPIPVDHSKKFSTPDWETTGWYSYCPRDLLLPLHGQIIECPASMRARYFETKIFEPLLYEYFNAGTKWISAPKPRLLDETFTFDNLRQPTLKNTEIIFDAPNVLRLGRDLLFQISNSGNHMGAKWLQSVLGGEYRVHVAEHIYSFAHLDSTIVPLRPGLVLLNASRVNEKNCPALFAKWDKIYFDDVAEIKSFLPNGISPCSPYIGLNLLSVNERLVILDENQVSLQRELAKRGIESIAMKMRHSRTLSGGFHCVTLDVRRTGGLESYCD